MEYVWPSAISGTLPPHLRFRAGLAQERILNFLPLEVLVAWAAAGLPW